MISPGHSASTTGCITVFGIMLGMLVLRSVPLGAQTVADNQNAQSSQADVQNLKIQADEFEDKSSQAIDDGNIAQGLIYMARAIALDPTPMRYMLYGSILYGNGMSVLQDGDQEKGKAILEQAQAQLLKAVQGFDPATDQEYLGQCYFHLAEIYLKAFGDKVKAKEYYEKADDLNDYPGAKQALEKLK